MIHITEVKRPTDRTYRNSNGIHAKVDRLLKDPITQNKLLQSFSYYERAEAGRYLRSLIEDGKVTSTGRGVSRDPIILTWA